MVANDREVQRAANENDVRRVCHFATVHARTVYFEIDGSPGAGRASGLWAGAHGRAPFATAHAWRAERGG
jgi:hypothetical protein